MMDQTKSGIEEYLGINTGAFFGIVFATACLVFGAFVWAQTGSMFMFGVAGVSALLGVFVVAKVVGPRGLISAIKKHRHGWATVAITFGIAALFTAMSTHVLDAILG